MLDDFAQRKVSRRLISDRDALLTAACKRHLTQVDLEIGKAIAVSELAKERSTPAAAVSLSSKLAE